MPRLTHRLATMLVSGCSDVQHAVAALIANMAVVSPASARVFAGLGCVDSLVALLAATAPRVQEQAALALTQLLSLDEDTAEREFDLCDERALKGGFTEAAIGLGAIGSLIDMATSGVPSLMRAAGDCCGYLVCVVTAVRLLLLEAGVAIGVIPLTGLCLRMFPQETIASTSSCLDRIVHLMTQPQYIHRLALLFNTSFINCIPPCDLLSGTISYTPPVSPPPTSRAMPTARPS